MKKNERLEDERRELNCRRWRLARRKQLAWVRIIQNEVKVQLLARPGEKNSLKRGDGIAQARRSSPRL